jgi:hypothetical protein
MKWSKLAESPDGSDAPSLSAAWMKGRLERTTDAGPER